MTLATQGAELKDLVRQDFGVTQLLEAVSLSQSFTFLLVVCESTVVTSELVKILQSAHRAVWHDPHHGQLDRNRPTAAEWLLPRVVDELLKERPSPEAPWILDASSSLAHDDDAWSLVFQRMNELRNEIARRHCGAFVLCIPQRMESLLGNAAPDFRAIRTAALSVMVTPALPTAGPPLRERPAAGPPLRIDESPSGRSPTAAEAVRTRFAQMLASNAPKARVWAEDHVAELRARALTEGADPIEVSLDLADWLVLAGEVQVHSRAFEAALKAYFEAVELLCKALVRDPKRLATAQRLADVWEHVRELELARGRQAEAYAASQNCVRVRETIADAAREDVDAQHRLAQALGALGEVAVRGGERGLLEAARDAWRRAAQILLEMIAHTFASVDWALEWGEIVEQLGHVEVALGQPAAAQAAWEDCAARLRAVAGVGARRRQILGRVLVELATLHEDASRRSELLDEAVSLLRDAAEERATFGRALAASGQLHEESASKELALARYRELQELVARTSAPQELEVISRVFVGAMKRAARLRRDHHDLPYAEAALREVCDLEARRGADPAERVASLLEWADLLVLLQRDNDVVAACLEALHIGREMKDFAGRLAWAASAVARVYRKVGRHAEAATQFSEAARWYAVAIDQNRRDPHPRRRYVESRIEEAADRERAGDEIGATTALQSARRVSIQLLAARGADDDWNEWNLLLVEIRLLSRPNGASWEIWQSVLERFRAPMPRGDRAATYEACVAELAHFLRTRAACVQLSEGTALQPEGQALALPDVDPLFAPSAPSPSRASMADGRAPRLSLTRAIGLGAALSMLAVGVGVMVSASLRPDGAPVATQVAPVVPRPPGPSPAAASPSFSGCWQGRFEAYDVQVNLATDMHQSCGTIDVSRGSAQLTTCAMRQCVSGPPTELRALVETCSDDAGALAHAWTSNSGNPFRPGARVLLQWISNTVLNARSESEAGPVAPLTLTGCVR